MKRVLAVTLLFAVSPALAAGYDDFSRGVNANNRGDADTAISSFTAALADGDLAPGYVPSAHYGRAAAYLRKHLCAQALADLDEVLKARPQYAEAYAMRGAANACLKKSDAAVADYRDAVRLEPSARLYETLAGYQWNTEDFPEAAENYAHAVKLLSNDSSHAPYVVLWYAMTADRVGTLDQSILSDAASKFGHSDWPGPLLDLFRGILTADKAYALASDRDPGIANNQKCEADFYIAEWQIARKDAAFAKASLQKARTECPHNFIEYFAAQTELDRQS